MKIHKGIFPTLTLFTSFSTLICCALPALLVSLGAGAVIIGLVSTFPQLIWLSEHKVGLFIFAGIMLIVTGMSRYMTRHASCPVDLAEAKACLKLRRISFGVFYCSVAMYGLGFFFAFIAQYLL
jgi:predicted benzoate:H+ symporter BenE